MQNLLICSAHLSSCHYVLVLPQQGTSDWSMAYAQHMARLSVGPVCKRSAMCSRSLDFMCIIYSTLLYIALFVYISYEYYCNCIV